MWKKLIGLVLAMMLACVPALAADYPLALTDDLGREVTVEAQPQTVVSLTASNTEILFALGLGSQVAGVDAWSNYPEEAAALENKVGDYNGPNIELIVSLKPDVVFAGNSLQADAISQLEQLGIVTVCNEATAYDKIPETIQRVADIMGADAQPLLTSMKQREQAVVDGVEGKEAPSVYFALSFGEYGDWTAGPGTFIDSLITLAGGKNVVTDVENPWPQYSLEQLIAQDPDVILVSGGQEMAEQFKSTDSYKDLRAVKEGRVYGVDADTSNRPGPRIVDALEEFASCIHGS